MPDEDAPEVTGVVARPPRLPEEAEALDPDPVEHPPSGPIPAPVPDLPATYVATAEDAAPPDSLLLGGDADAPAAAPGATAPALLPPDPAVPPGLFGKLPLRGDFLSRNLPRPLLRHLETWLDTVMTGAREGLGADWAATFDQSPVWHFWIGGGLWGQPCTGALMPSRDGVGRRFPLVLLLADGAPEAAPRCPPPPVIDPADDWHAACTAFLRAAPALTDPDALDRALAALPRPRPEDVTQAGLARDPKAAIWATTPPGAGFDLATLFADIAASDHTLAAQGRSYWWTGHPGDAEGTPAPPGAFVALSGLPDAQVFAFLLGGAGTARLANGGGSA